MYYEMGIRATRLSLPADERPGSHSSRRGLSWRLAALLVGAATVLPAHFTWIAPETSPLAVGQVAKVQVGSGHQFPESETAIRLADVEVYAISPSGRKSNLAPAAAGTSLASDYKVGESGMHRLVLVQDRGVLSWTTQGVRSGGKAEHPGAVRSARIFRSSVSYALTEGAQFEKAKPLGLPFEITAEVSGRQITLTVLKDAKPCSGVEMLMAAGDHGDKAIGKTAADGRLVYSAGPDVKGPLLFGVEYVEPAPASANYDRSEFAATVQLQL